jgi:predicted nucleic acid-binding protein
VVDASVAAKWLLPAAAETFVVQANRLLELHVQRKTRLKAPDLIWSELGNILWKAVRSARTSRADAHSSLLHFSALSVDIIPAQDLWTLALQIATAYDRTFYDSLYVALALHANAELITADERLANALASRFPVTWL